MTDATVVIVDDDHSFVEALALYLRKHGFHTRKGFNGRDALALFRSSDVDVAVIDVHLPDISGVEIAKNVSSSHRAPAIILISGDDTLRITGEFPDPGAVQFMPKPLDPRALLGAIRSCVRERHRDAPAIRH